MVIPQRYRSCRSLKLRSRSYEGAGSSKMLSSVKRRISPFSRQSGLSSSQGFGTVGRKSMNRRANWNGGEKSARAIETSGSKRSLLAEDLKPSDFPPPQIPDFRGQLNPLADGT